MSLLLLLICFQRPSFHNHYEAGLTHLQQKQYESAISELEKAIELRPDASPNAKTYGVQFVAYFPYHRLSMAHLWIKDRVESKRYLDLAYRQNEDKDGGPAVRARMEMLRELLSTQVAEVPKNTPPPQADITPMIGMLLSGELDDASDYIALMLESHPKDKRLIEFQKTVNSHIANNKRLEEDRKRFEDQLNDLLKEARKLETEGNYQAALSRFTNINNFAPDQQEARAAITRLKRTLAESDLTESQIQEIMVKAQSDKNQLELRLEQQINQTTAMRLANDQLKADFQKQLKEISSEKTFVPIIETEFDFTPGLVDGQRRGTLNATVSGNVAIQKAELFLNDRLQKTWDILNQKNFNIPGLQNHPFEKNINIFRLELTDSNGTVTKEEFNYKFPPSPKPFYKKQSFRNVTGLVIGSFICFFLFARFSRRRKAFRERFNPYVAGAPVLNKKMFYGRTPILKQILNAIHNNSLMIFGERRIGKTSLMHRLYNTLPEVNDPEYTFLPVMVDLQGIKEEDFFPTLDSEICQTIEGLGIEVEEAETPPNARQFTSRLRKNIGKLKKHYEKKPKLVLLLDEVDIMNSYSEHTNQQLRSVFMKGFAEHIVAVMAGIHINTRWKSEGSPWYNFFEQIELKPFTRKQAEVLISQPVEGIYTYTSSTIDRIMEITSGKPYLIQKMCLNLVSYALLNNKRKLTHKDVDIVFNDISKEFYGGQE